MVLGDGRVLADEEPVGGLHGVLAGAPGVLDALHVCGACGLLCDAGCAGGYELQIWTPGVPGVLDAFSVQAAGELYCTAGLVLAGVDGEELQVWAAGVPGVLDALLVYGAGGLYCDAGGAGG